MLKEIQTTMQDQYVSITKKATAFTMRSVDILIRNSNSGIKDAGSNNQNIVRNSSKQTSYNKYNNNATNPRSQYTYDKNKYNNIYPNVKNSFFTI